MNKKITRTPFPNSEKVYVKGKLFDIEVPMRKINLTPTATVKNGEKSDRKSVV